MSTQPTPEALRLADELLKPMDGFPTPTVLEAEAAAELLRLHDENAQLREQNTALDAACAKLEAVRGTPATGGAPVAYLIDWPDEPELGHYFAETPTQSGRSQPLYTSPQPVREPHPDTKRLAWMADGWTPGHEAMYVQHVLSTGGTGDLYDMRTFIDKQIAHGITGGQHGTDA